MSRRNIGFVASLAIAVVHVPALGGTIYVDGNATGPIHDGSSWCSAFLELTDALVAAPPGYAIHVADGVYRPDQGSGQIPGDRSASFVLVNGVELLGGFAGCGALVPDQRDVNLFETLLSGDLADNDGPNFANNEENAFHVLTGDATDSSTVVDGFTVTGGNADATGLPHDAGGGMRIAGGAATIYNCVFTGNSATFGGGLENFNGGNPTISACLFVENRATFRGGGMHNNASHPILIDTVFLDNVATNSGGGMRNYSFSEPVLTRCEFLGNLAGFGGGMVNDESSPLLRDCIFRANTADDTSGGMHNWISHPLLVNCLFVDNAAATKGGAIYNLNTSSPTLTNCTVGGNFAGVDGGGLFATASSGGSLTNCIVWGNTGGALSGGGTFSMTYSNIEGGSVEAGNISADPAFIDSAVGDLRLSNASPSIDAGTNIALPSDALTDLDGRPRFFDVPHVPDTGKGTPSVVDMGAYEFGAGACVDGGNFAVFLCHRAPGSTGRPFTIRVGVEEAFDHFAHGDTCGSCTRLSKSP